MLLWSNEVESWKYDALRTIFDELRGVSSHCVECLRFIMILEGEVKDAKMSSFFYLISKHSFNINFLGIFFKKY